MHVALWGSDWGSCQSVTPVKVCICPDRIQEFHVECLVPSVVLWEVVEPKRQSLGRGGWVIGYVALEEIKVALLGPRSPKGCCSK